MEEETRYFYQPNLTTTIISWCWTFLIFIAGLVVRRTVLITPSKMVFSRVLQKDYLVIPLADIRQPRFTKHTVSLTVNGEVFNFAFSNKAIRRLKLALNNLKGEQQG